MSDIGCISLHNIRYIYLKSIKHHYNSKLTFRYEKLHERQKDLQHKINAKISNDIYNVQQVLEALVRQNQSQDIDSMQSNNTTFQETNEKENEEQPNNSITNIDEKENNKIIDYKTKADWYASLLMYNSY
jgi:hypothetical protein